MSNLEGIRNGIRSTIIGRRNWLSNLFRSYIDYFSNNRSRRYQRRRQGRSSNDILSPPHLQRCQVLRRNGFPYQSFTSYGHSNINERNLWAALITLLVIAALSAAIAQPKWLSIKGGPCNKAYIGLQEFFYLSSFNYFDSNFVPKPNHINLTNGIRIDDKEEGEARIFSTTFSNSLSPTLFEKLSAPPMTKLNTKKIQSVPHLFLHNSNFNLRNCITSEIAHLQRWIITLCFLGITMNLCQFFLDTLGTKKEWINSVRRHALGSIFGVICCISVIGIVYMVSDLLEQDQRKSFNKNLFIGEHHVSQIQVHFELSYYLIGVAGLLGLIATALNLFTRPKLYTVLNNVPFQIYDHSLHSSPVDPFSRLWPSSFLSSPPPPLSSPSASSLSPNLPPPICPPPPPYVP